MMDTCIVYEIQSYGYVIEVIVGGRIVAQYEAGNNPIDSSPDAWLDEGGLTEEVMTDYAIQTAKEFAEEYGLPESAVVPA